VKRIVSIALLSLLLTGMLFFAVRSYGEAKAYEETTARIVKEMNPESLAKFRLKEWAQTLSFGLYTNKQRKALEVLKVKQRQYRRTSREYMYKSMVCLLLLLGAYFFVSLRMFIFFGALAAWIMLFFGIVTPILMVTIHKEVEYLGDVVLSFESKSIVGSLVKLYDHGDVAVAAVILLFSVLIPFVKTFFLMFVSLFLQSRFAHGVVKFFKMIGKWSMVDVFVVATFLVYLTVDKGDVSRAEVEAGLYFFLAYVIVSMLVSLTADRMLHRLKKA